MQNKSDLTWVTLLKIPYTVLHDLDMTVSFKNTYIIPRNHSGYGLGQWEEALYSNAVSHWPSPYPEWSLLTFFLFFCGSVMEPALAFKKAFFTNAGGVFDFLKLANFSDSSASFAFSSNCSFRAPLYFLLGINISISPPFSMASSTECDLDLPFFLSLIWTKSNSIFSIFLVFTRSLLSKVLLFFFSFLLSLLGSLGLSRLLALPFLPDLVGGGVSPAISLESISICESFCDDS